MPFPLGNRPSRSTIATALAELAALFGNRLVTSDAVRAQHANITTWFAEGIPDGVIFPQSVDDVQSAMRVCARHDIPVIPSAPDHPSKATSMHPLVAFPST